MKTKDCLRSNCDGVGVANFELHHFASYNIKKLKS